MYYGRNHRRYEQTIPLHVRRARQLSPAVARAVEITMRFPPPDETVDLRELRKLRREPRRTTVKLFHWFFTRVAL